MDVAYRPAPWLIALALCFLIFGPLAAQSPGPAGRTSPTTGFMVAGYGTTGWQSIGGDSGRNDFFGSVSPLLLFRFGNRFLYETELEFEVEDGVTQTSLEYAQLNYFLTDNITLVAGKFLLPFGVFAERLHPTWINRMASPPPLFGHGGGELSPLLPMPSDFGVMVRGSWAFQDGRAVTTSLFITQGPSAEGHGEEEEVDLEGEGDSAPFPEFQFGKSSADINKDKMVGGRLGWVVAPNFEMDVSGMTGAFDDEGSRLSGLNVAAEFRRGATELRGEGFALWYDVEGPGTGGESHEEGATTPGNTGGFYLQASHRRGAWEPVARWTQRVRTAAEGYENADGFTQLGFGLNYWFSPAIALMASYEINDSANSNVPDRFLTHWSFGF